MYPLKVEDGVIYVDVSQAKDNIAFGRGGSDSAVGGGDVYSLEQPILVDPRQGRDAQGNRTMDASSIASLIAGVVAVGMVALVGTFVFDFYEVKRGVKGPWGAGDGGRCAGC